MIDAGTVESSPGVPRIYMDRVYSKAHSGAVGAEPGLLFPDAITFFRLFRCRYPDIEIGNIIQGERRRSRAYISFIHKYTTLKKSAKIALPFTCVFRRADV